MMSSPEATFQFERAAIRRALAAEKIIPLYPVEIIEKGIGAIVYLAGMAWVVALLLETFGFMGGLEVSHRILGATFLALAFGMPFWAYWWFVVSELRRPPLPYPLARAAGGEVPGVNIAEYLDFEAAAAAASAFAGAEGPGAREIFSALREHPFVRRLFHRLGIPPDRIAVPDSPVRVQTSVNAVMKKAFEEASFLGGEHIGVPSLFLALAEMYPPLKQALFDAEITHEELRTVVHWERYQDVVQERRRKFWLAENLGHVRGIGLEWARTGTWRLEQYAEDMRDVLRGHEFLSHAIGRKQEILQTEEGLVRGSENNVLIVGKPGVGRHALVYRFADRVISGRGIRLLAHFRIFFLDLGAVISQGTHKEDVLNEIRRVFTEAASARNVILVVDNFETYLGEAIASPLPDLTGLFLQFLPDPDFRLIAIASRDAYHRTIEPQKGLLSNFFIVSLEEPEEEMQRSILLDALPEIERRARVMVSYPAVRSVLRLGKQYFPNEPFPEKGIDLLDEAVGYAMEQRRADVGEDDVRAVVAAKTQAPVGEASSEEKKKLLKLEELLHRRIVNQEAAVSVIAEALRRVRAQIQSSKRPIGSFLFLGPTGVGKTETAKALAEVYYGSEDRMVRLDMSEYQRPESITLLIGSSDGRESGRLSSIMLDRPFSLVLLDEIEKAHPKILDILLQVLDEGKYTDARGDTISFINALIIATSNAGSEFIRERIQTGAAARAIGKEVVEYILRENIFKPEFLNRFDAVVSYPPLSREHLREIAKLLLRDLAERLMEGNGVTLDITDELAAKVAELGYDPQFGARPMRRVIQDKIEGLIARRILEGTLKRGGAVSLHPGDIA